MTRELARCLYHRWLFRCASSIVFDCPNDWSIENHFRALKCFSELLLQSRTSAQRLKRVRVYLRDSFDFEMYQKSSRWTTSVTIERERFQRNRVVDPSSLRFYNPSNYKIIVGVRLSRLITCVVSLRLRRFMIAAHARTTSDANLRFNFSPRSLIANLIAAD